LELNTLQTYIRSKTNDIVTVERIRTEQMDILVEQQKNLDMCIQKNANLVQRINELEKELNYCRAQIHEFKTTKILGQANKQVQLQ
jgi:hypothetical protein